MSRVALLQVASHADESVDHRVDRVLGMVADTLPDCDIAVLPELWMAGAFDLPLIREIAAPLDFAVLERLRTLAADASTWLHAGSFAERLDDGTTYNTAVLIDASGEIVATYRKRHLFGFEEGERTIMSAGEDLVVLDTPLGRTGLATCYDLRFPEMFRDLTRLGAQTFLLCSGWPTVRIEHWRMLARARAIEDLAWFVATNGVGSHAGITLCGHSVVIDPQGGVVAEAGEAEEVIFAEVDPTASDEWRTEFPALTDRL